MATLLNLSLETPTIGGSDNTWGGILNTDLQKIDAVFDGSGSGTVVGLQIGSGKTLKVMGSLVCNGSFAHGNVTVSAAGVASPITVNWPTASGTLSTSAGGGGGVTGPGYHGQLSSNLSLPSGTFVSGPTTGAVGGSGQRWLVMASFAISTSTGSGTEYFTARFSNGSSQIGSATQVVSTMGSQINVSGSLSDVIDLSGPTNLILQVQAASSSNGSLIGGAHITAVRVQ